MLSHRRIQLFLRLLIISGCCILSFLIGQRTSVNYNLPGRLNDRRIWKLFTEKDDASQTVAALLKVRKSIAQAHRYARSGKSIHFLAEAQQALNVLLNGSDELRKAHESESKDVCKENYLGKTQKNMASHYGHPFYYTGYEIEKCNYAPPLSSILSVVLFDDDSANADSVYDQIQLLYPGMKVYLIGQTKGQRKTVFIDSVKFKGAAALNKVAGMIDTKYVLFGRGALEVFDSNVRLERLVRTLSESRNAAAVGGTYRNATGHWRFGCYQSTMRNYAYKLVAGYDLSNSHSCAYCDVIAGPFVTYTRIVKDLPFEYSRTELSFLGLFEKLKLAEHSCLVCADSMFHVKKHTPLVEQDGYERKDFIEFATDWSLSRIELPQATLEYSCGEVGIKCFKAQAGVAVPRCCIENLSRMFRILMKKCDQHRDKLGCVLDGGTVVAAVKIGGISIWEFDADLRYRDSGHELLGTFTDDLRNAGYQLEERSSCNSQFTSFQSLMMQKPITHCGRYTLSDGFWYIDLWGQTRTGLDDWIYNGGMDHSLFINANRTATLMLIDGEWLPSFGNPALYARNLYGDDILQHVEHWRAINYNYMQADGDSHNYSTGNFVTCPKKLHHACLDQYMGEGNLQFQETFL